MLKDSIASAEKAAGRPLKRSEVSSYWSQKAHDWIRRHPIDFLKLLGTKFKNFWSAFSYDDISVVTALRDQSVTFPGEGFGLIAALGFVFFISHKRVWAMIRDGQIVLAGEANRNHAGFEDKFRTIVDALKVSN